MFEIGKEYKRSSDIHDKYGGQRRGGISTPKNFPFIFVFTSASGEQHGYTDEFQDGIFWYTGEGQVGDMRMVSGNRAILEHVQDGKTVHVFESTRSAYVQYLGSAECLGYHTQIRPDRNGADRTAFIFHLDIDSMPPSVSVSETPPLFGPKDFKQLKKKNIKQLREAALIQRPTNISLKEKQELAHYRSHAIKLYVNARSKGRCEGCENEAPFQTKNGPYLECHHIYRLADGGPDHPKNVIALCPNCHRRAHYAKDAVGFNNKLKDIAAKAENSDF